MSRFTRSRQDVLRMANDYREIIDDLLRREIIKPSKSPYCARVVSVRKRNGALRLCIDLRPLNSRVIKQRYPFPLIEDCIARLGDKSVFTLLDLKDGFHHLKIYPEHTKYFAFATPDGQYEYLRLPFGFCEAPAEFQRRITQVLQPLSNEDKVIVYIDDILIPSKTIEDNLETLRQTLLILKSHGFELNMEKCSFLKKSIEYLGYVIASSGITLSQRHVDAIEKFRTPTRVVELQRFLGLTNYFRKFIPDYASIAKPLHNLLRKSVPYNFDIRCEQAFSQLKKRLMSFPVLQIYNPLFETQLHTDASSVAVAAILLQKQKSGLWGLVAYFSQVTNSAESRYHSFELEMLAVVKAVERFHLYLYGLRFTVVTDCHALVYAIDKANLNPRIARWTLRLQNYNFKIQHRAGTKMSHVDALSRISSITRYKSIDEELQYRQLTDPKIQAISNLLETSDHEEYTLIDGLVYKKGPDKPKFYVPEPMVGNLLRLYHDDQAHCSIEKTYQGLASNYWFPSMRNRIKEHVENCLVCMLANTSTNVREGELQTTFTPNVPFQVVHTAR